MNMLNTNSIQNNEIIQYCLYARKSTEDDERQAMSIDSQIKEMTEMAQKEGLFIKELRRESHSAKMSGQRPEFNRLINNIRDGVFTGILTWAPDRLSRNAGDLGMLVDLMDEKKIIHIKTFTQAFSNSPSDKFLLMILCSQAKLENDQKGINVKRGIRAKCEMGWRPGIAPLGYMNRAFGGTKDVIIDLERAEIIKGAFYKAAAGMSGRKLKRWMDDSGFTTRSGKKVTLSSVFLILKNPFYYGSFEYPVGSGSWYKGGHDAIISKETFDKVQTRLIVPKKAKWGSKKFLFKGIFKCATCGTNIVAEDRWRKRKWDQPRYHVYYHCTRQKMYDCPEPYLTEEKLIKQILRYLNFMYIAHPQIFPLEKIQKSMDNYKQTRDEILWSNEVNPANKPLHFMDYANFIFKNGNDREKVELSMILNRQLYLHNEIVTSSPIF